MTTFLLVQGAFEGGWYWRPLAKRLEAAGHEVFRPTFTGLGERAHLMSRAVDLETHIADILNVIKYERLDDIVMVGHSYGGMVITGVADRAWQKMRALVYLDAALPENGQAMFDLLLPERRAAMTKSAEEKGEGWMVPVPPYTSWGMTPEHAAEMEARSVPHPLATFTQKLKLDGNHLKVPRKVYMVAAHYKPSPFHKFADWARGRDGWSVLDLPTHHFPMVSMPDEVAGHLMAIAR
jgi:pimeloyl-ACP methyl ester carboxylesterase